jgi:hypothetical protein
VDAAEDHERASLFYQTPDGIPPKSIPSMNPYADDIAGRNVLYVQRFQSFITQDGVAEFRRRGGGDNKQPTRRDNGSTERGIAWVD